MRRLHFLPGLLVSCIPAVGLAQQPLPATTVQLPTISQFTVQTTVSVPDGGTMNLGGIGSGFDSRATRGIGPLRSRASSSGRTASGVSVSTRIIDHAEIDRAVLAAAAGRRSPAGAASESAEAISKVVRSSAAPPASVAAIRQANAVAAERESAELADLLAKGQAAETAGKTGVAKVYYQMLARRDRGNCERSRRSGWRAALQIK